MAGRPHEPRRPLWLCRRCAEPWPCATARLDLLHEYRADRVGLSVYMAVNLFDAAADLHRLSPEPGPDPAQLYARFLQWTGRGRGPATSPAVGD
ncbi:hypothetical protein O7632_25175 [Solwaraspora sp. WMMD406]|uniref:hypothetical protein n=1 Tax=Solwaraspora sp. WMMD406 TaxID=3016095 RepID=UPI002417E1A2|nr:hypothetical protein [Solwaraspora sp. WMMD406]MDG4767357.1 hypothetical protein [Solwaraspora sp. WMMD406]